MIVSVAFFSKEFSNLDRKEAYKKATNWIAKNVVTSKDENKETAFKIEEIKTEVLPTFKVTLYCAISTTDLENRFCETCKNYHKSFFINQEYNCNACRHKSFLKRAEETLSIKRSYRKEKLKHRIDKK